MYWCKNCTRLLSKLCGEFMAWLPGAALATPAGPCGAPDMQQCATGMCTEAKLHLCAQLRQSHCEEHVLP